MPDESYNAALLNYAGQVASSATGAMAQQKLNKKTMEYNDEWAYRRREWDLQDWDRVNEYNLPKNQRQRLIDANINPALMYGKGPGDMTAGPIKAGGVPSWNPKAPDYSGMNPLSSLSLMYDIKMKKATVEQMNLQNQKLIEDTKLSTKKWWSEDVKNQLAGIKANLTNAELQIMSEKLEAIQQYKEDTGKNFFRSSNDAMLKRQEAEAKTALTNSEIAVATKEASIEKAFEAVSLMREQNAKTQEEKKQIKANTELIKKSGVLKDYEIQFMSQGGRWAPLFLGILGKLL